MSPFTPTTARRCAWPNGVDLPKGQSSMDDLDWIDFFEEHLAGIDTLTGVDRLLCEDDRRSLLTLRRYHYAAAGERCPRWPARRAA